jgi:putative transposase
MTVLQLNHFFSHLKKEEVNRNVYKSFKELKESIDSYINFYNNNRPHMSLGYLTPVEYEKNRTS